MRKARDRRVTFERLVVGLTIRHANGTCYKIVKVKDPPGKQKKVWALWRNGHIGRFGKEVVRLTPKHVLGFLRYSSRQHRPSPVREDRGG